MTNFENTFTKVILFSKSYLLGIGHLIRLRTFEWFVIDYKLRNVSFVFDLVVDVKGKTSRKQNLLSH